MRRPNARQPCGQSRLLRIRAHAAITLASLLLAAGPITLHAAAPIKIGLNADLSGADETVGRAIERGALLAIEEINDRGGLLGRPVELDLRDHRRNPARGEANVHALADDPDVVAILGGKHTPVIIQELGAIHAREIPYLIPWAAGTPLIEHRYSPSYTFRLSLRDEFVGRFLVEEALRRGFTRVALVLEQTGWGRSNKTAMHAALAEAGLAPVTVAWFHWDQRDFRAVLDMLAESDAEVMLFVGNTPEALGLLRALVGRPAESRPSVISHWGLLGDDFEIQGEPLWNQLDLSVVYTFSFAAPPRSERAAPLAARYLERFDPDGEAARIAAAPGVVHAYDLVQLLALAVEAAGSTDRRKVRAALENIDHHDGVLRDYAPPFTADRHDALGPEDYRLGRFENGSLVPMEPGEPLEFLEPSPAQPGR